MKISGNIWDELQALLVQQLDLLPDKPEETPEATLQALWWKASGRPLSAVAASRNNSLPDISPLQEKELRTLVALRLSGIPLAHLTGRQHFMDLELLASPDALVPRRETELLGHAALDLLRGMASNNDSPIYIDVCTGAGNLPVALSSQVPNVRAYAADISEEAVKLAQQNVALYDLGERVTLRVGDLLMPFDSEQFYSKVDLLTCNPPYISSAKVVEMHSEISKHEPGLAFDGGPFGITILRRLIGEAPKFLKPGGWLAYEVGLGQGENMIRYMERRKNYCAIRPVLDEHGNIRAILAQL